MVKHYSFYSANCCAWSAVGPLYGLAGCMNPKSALEVMLLPHVAMVVSKQHHYVVETLPISINIDRKEASAAYSEASHPPQCD